MSCRCASSIGGGWSQVDFSYLDEVEGRIDGRLRSAAWWYDASTESGVVLLAESGVGCDSIDAIMAGELDKVAVVVELEVAAREREEDEGVERLKLVVLGVLFVLLVDGRTRSLAAEYALDGHDVRRIESAAGRGWRPRIALLFPAALHELALEFDTNWTLAPNAQLAIFPGGGTHYKVHQDNMRLPDGRIWG